MFMFSRNLFTGFKKTAAVFLAVCMLAGLFTCLTAVSVIAEDPVATEQAVFIGKTGSEKQAAIFVPVDIKHPTEDMSLFEGDEFFQVSFKCKMLSGSKPIVGVYGIDPTGSTNGSYSRPDWCDQDSVVIEDGVCTATIKVNFPYVYQTDSETGEYVLDGEGNPVATFKGRKNPNGEGYRSFYLVIGNSYYNGSSTSYGDFDDSFILSDIKLAWLNEGVPDVNEETGEVTNYLKDTTVNFKGTYFFKYDGCDNWDSPLGSTAMQWHVLAAPAFVKQITVPADYNTSDNYAASAFEKHDATELTREYYTNAAYADKTFALLKNSENAGFELISSDINKKMVVIDANHEGEADINTATGNEAAPKYNRAANIFLPISYGQYAMKGSTAQDINFLVKVSFKAVRLEGDSTPVIGRIVGKKKNTSGKGSQALPKMAYNIPAGDYTSNQANYSEKYYDADNNRLKCEYNAETGEFVGWMRVRAADNDYASRFGCNEIITIGNAEHVYAAGGKFDSTSFNSSFAISNIKVDLYECGSGYVRGNMIAEDIAPGLYAETLDTNSRWAYQYRIKDGYEASNSDYDCIRAPQNLWSAEGNVGMVHSADLTDCMANGHTVTHNAATETTREYWTCSCGKTFAEAYCKTEINDLSAAKRAIYVAASENPATAFIPLKLCGYEGNRWFKFTCKCKLIGGESVPVVSTLYNIYNGSNQCETTTTDSNDGDMAVFEYTYDPATYTLTAYIKCWIKNTINQDDRYPFERINAVSGANIALLIGNGRFIGSGYTDAFTDTDFAISEPELYMLSCTGGGSALEEAKTSEAVSENIIAPITDKTVDLDAEYVATWTNANNPLSGSQNVWYRTGADKANITTKVIPDNYFTDEYVDCYHEHTEVRDAVEATATTDGYTGDTYCLDCGLKLASGEVIPKLDNHIPGDINMDGKVNNKDLTRLFQFLSDWEVEVDTNAIDVNGDGKVNNKDLTRLFQYLSDWEVEIF